MRSTQSPRTAGDKLTRLWAESPRRFVGVRDKFVILSDLHMGDGGRKDDFLHNGRLCQEALEHYYSARDYTLILNGDIEELLKIPRPDIQRAWPGMYQLFQKFREEGRLIWLRGNHEIVPARAGDPEYENHFDGESVILECPEGSLFVFHGHQAGIANSGRFNRLIGWSLKALAHPLGIGNHSVAHSSRRKFKLEQAVHDFSRREGLVSIIGHTHRPLFESLTRRESLGIRIEQMCRDYHQAAPERRDQIRRTVRALRRSLDDTRHPRGPVTRVYGETTIPCVFNAGCAVGKRGFTVLEIKNGKIGLAFWSSPERSWIPEAYNEHRPSRRHGELAYRTILRRESLAYVFSRIELLKEV